MPAEKIFEIQKFIIHNPKPWLRNSLDMQVIKDAKEAIDEGKKVNLDYKILNPNRVFGTILSNEVSKIWEEKGYLKIL
ncbi:MAG: hypothetical protein Ct9H90mP4_01030 [Gammaproteobacteria bacterium]|nr:MAG: hypothetical protein Ct9H90mP4_01030 [Gammaproteobacteria bacterium]